MSLLELYDQLVNFDFSEHPAEDEYNFQFKFEGNHITGLSTLDDIGNINVVIEEDEHGFNDFNVKIKTDDGHFGFDIGAWVPDLDDEEEDDILLDEEDYGQYFFEKLDIELFRGL
jgi:hypothetical protein